MPSPVDCSVWGTVCVFAGNAAVVRRDPRANPPATALAEIYNVPPPGFGPRGADIDSQGVAIARQRTSRQLRPAQVQGSAQRPQSHRRSVPGGAGPCTSIQGWALLGLETTAPRRVITAGSTRAIRSGSGTMFRSRPAMNDALLALVKGTWVVLRVPYPLIYYAKGLDGGIADPNAGWKGARYGRRAATGRRGSRKAARIPFQSLSIPGCAPIRSPTDGRAGATVNHRKHHRSGPQFARR